MPIARALLSVSDKHGLADFARALAKHGIELLSTGGTAQALRNAGLEVRDVANYTGFPEIMGGRVKTLHPRIHGGLLGRRGTDEAIMHAHGIAPIDLLVVNLYPFAATIAQPNVTYAEAIENIDVGGSAMLRAAAKNHADVTVLVDPRDYATVLAEIAATGETSIDTRSLLAAKAFAHTAEYDTAVAGYLQRAQSLPIERFPERLALMLEKVQDLRYGENPHQRAAWYRTGRARRGSIGAAQMLQGKELSFNNLQDADTAIECVRQFAEPACTIVKHANPCGVALAETLAAAYELAYRTDPTSAYGGIIAFNRPLDVATARAIIMRQFAEVIAAPAMDAEALDVLRIKPDIRVLVLGGFSATDEADYELRSLNGAVLVQDRDTGTLPESALKVVTQREPDQRELADLRFAWQVGQFVKSNAIVFARDRATLGVGAGQMSRVYSTRIAALKAGDEKLELRGAVMASDAFLPFRDGVEVAARFGIGAIIQPGGSKRDAEVIAAANAHGMAMVCTGMRHFRH
ncbi:MAG TPA: bifunctional phosphoribosylaminoimidazolecarboxamide formyltransferase/IMP cyclohydrolase [Steroidobacteraceae bacterium]|nr:bifunctional phosphoribosylaminoimidazolecarboxamide formyltransferase/IMP cyclohydrolase [Steroidobacteraceae bacterium]